MDSYLDGGLKVERLDCQPRGGRFRAEDERGAVAWLARGEAYEYLHAIEFRDAGVRRGFHAHREHAETLYVVSGRLQLVARHSGGGDPVRVELTAGDSATFGPDVAHGLIALEPAFAVSLGAGADPIHGGYPVPDLDAA
jgi:mannose-6-phosphate isomerase-like protein (cupin superfamily)